MTDDFDRADQRPENPEPQPDNAEQQPETPERRKFQVRISQDGSSSVVFSDMNVLFGVIKEACKRAVDGSTRQPEALAPVRKACRRKPTNVVPPPIFNNDDLPTMLTVEQVAGYLRMTVGAVYVLVQRKRPMGIVRRGTRILFRRDQFLSAVRAGTL